MLVLRGIWRIRVEVGQRGKSSHVHSVYLPRVTTVGIQSNDKRAKHMRALRTVITARWFGGLIVAYSERRLPSDKS